MKRSDCTNQPQTARHQCAGQRCLYFMLRTGAGIKRGSHLRPGLATWLSAFQFHYKPELPASHQLMALVAPWHADSVCEFPFLYTFFFFFSQLHFLFQAPAQHLKVSLYNTPHFRNGCLSNKREMQQNSFPLWIYHDHKAPHLKWINHSVKSDDKNGPYN